MSQQYFSGEEYSHEPDKLPNDAQASNLNTDNGSPYKPQYMTVGGGSHSANVTALIEQLERDSGYGSLAGDGYGNGGEMRDWEGELLQDRPTPAHTPRLPGQSGTISENEKKALASHVHQLYYNQNRVALAKAIGQTIELLKQLQEMNV